MNRNKRIEKRKQEKKRKKIKIYVMLTNKDTKIIHYRERINERREKISISTTGVGTSVSFFVCFHSLSFLLNSYKI